MIQMNCCNWQIEGNFSRFLGSNKCKNRTSFTSREVSSLTVLRKDQIGEFGFLLLQDTLKFDLLIQHSHEMTKKKKSHYEIK